VRSPRAASLLFATDNRRNGHHACSKLTVPRANQPLHGPLKILLPAILAKLRLPSKRNASISMPTICWSCSAIF